MTGKKLALKHWNEKRDKVPHFLELAQKMVDNGNCYDFWRSTNDCPFNDCPFNDGNYRYCDNLCYGNCKSYLKELKKLSGGNMKEKFIEFLKERGIYEKFVGCVYLNKDRNRSFIQTRDFEDVFKKPENTYIDQSFDWGKTEDGGEYWNNIYNEWMEILKASQKKPLLTHNGIEWSEDTVKSILDKYSKESKCS